MYKPRLRHPLSFEPLEGRTLLAWGGFPQLIDQDVAANNFPQYNGSGQTIAIIDTGADYTHPALSGKYLGGYDFADDDSNPMDFDGHGTALASLAVGNQFTFNGAQYQGIAPGAKFVALRVDDGSDVPDARYEAALQWVLDNRQTFGISAVSLSFGEGHYSTEAQRAIYADELAQLKNLGVFIVASSGNSGPGSPFGVEYPAADPSVFAAGAIDSSDKIWSSTERGAIMDVLAPGVNVPAAYLDPADQDHIYLAATGTSFSAPIVAALGMIVKQIDSSFTAHDVMSIIRTGGVDNFDGDNESSPNTQISYPRVDVDSAIVVALARRGGQASSANVGNNGTDNAMAYDRDGVLHFAWYDKAAKNLKYATKNVNGDWSAVRTVDAANTVGQFLSLAVASTGKPGISYYDAPNANLKYAEWTGQTWSVQTVDSFRTVGLYTSLKFDAFDDPVVTYYYKNTGDLRIAFDDGTGWVKSTIDSNQDVGRYSSFAISNTGQWSVAYENTTTGQFKFAKLSGSTWSAVTADAKTKRGGGNISLAYGPSNRPAFSYYDAFNGDLKFAQFNGSVWSTTTVASKLTQGLYTNLFLEANGNADIVYFHKTSNRVFRARGAVGNWTVSALTSDGGSSVSTARYNSTARAFSYVHTTTGKVRIEGF